MSAKLSLPDPEEKEQAKKLGEELSRIEEIEKKGEIKLVFRRGTEMIELPIPLPLMAFHLLIKIIDQMALGNSVTLIPGHAQLTTQEAANLLNVSRPFVVKLIEEGKIKCVKVGTHRRIVLKDLLEYKERVLAESEKARARLAELGKEMEMELDE